MSVFRLITTGFFIISFALKDSRSTNRPHNHSLFNIVEEVTWQKEHNSNLTRAHLTKQQFSLRRRENEIRSNFRSLKWGTSQHSKYAVSVILQVSESWKLGWGLAHVLSIYNALRKLDGDYIDLVVWLVDLEGLHPRKILDEKTWQYLDSIPGFFVKGGGLCSEFDLTLSDINVFQNGHVVVAVLAQLKKIKSITLDMYERVAQIDWDILPIKPMLGMFEQDMLGSKVMAGTDNRGPFFGGVILLQPDFDDYRYICKNILNGLGWTEDQGWNGYGDYLTPFCPANRKWGICDPPQYADWGFHAAMSDQGLFFYYYGLLNDWLLTIDKPRRGPRHYYRKFGSELFDGGVWNGTGIVDTIHYKGQNKLRKMFYDYAWRENMFEAYHRLNMSQIGIFREVYEEMLTHEHGTANSWE